MSGERVATIASCRSCGDDRLVPVFDLGEMPLSDGFTESASAPDPRYPLEVVFCEGCSLAQLRHTVAPEVLFGDDYPYFSSYTDTVVRNAAASLDEALRRRPLAAGARVVELASNDGYLLQHAKDRGLDVLGIDPAAGPVAAARARGIACVHDFFSRELARHVVAERGPAQLIFANNVLAHVADTRDFVAGIASLLAPDGMAVIEVPHLTRLLEKVAFDTIYHEHLCYFSVSALVRLFEAEGLFLTDLEELPIHGGSLRLYVEKRPASSERVDAALADERAGGLDRASAFASFADAVAGVGEKLRGILAEARREGATIAAYGAAAKGTILLNTFGIGPALVDYVVDRNPHKHGRFVPGVKLPVLPVEELDRRPPDLIVILPWNHRDEIMSQLEPHRARGAAFLLPVPEPTVVR